MLSSVSRSASVAGNPTAAGTTGSAGSSSTVSSLAAAVISVSPLNSETMPVTSTCAPTPAWPTVSAEYTKIASEATCSLGSMAPPAPGVWIVYPAKLPVGYVAVTIPRVFTRCPASGLAGPVPWISEIGVTVSGSIGSGCSTGGTPEAVGVGAAAVKSAALSSVSANPARSMLWAAVGAGAGAAPSNRIAEP